MANLEHLLKETLLLQSCPSLRALDEPDFTIPDVPPCQVPTWVNKPNEQGRMSRVAEMQPARPSRLVDLSGQEFHHKRIWHYDWNPGRLTEIRRLTVRNRMMNDMEMTVCDSIRWGPISVKYGPHTYPLPLTRDYLVQTYWLDGGPTCEEGVVKEASSGFWQLAANLHSSYQLVFAFEMPRDRSGTKWERPTPATYRDWSFIDEPSNGPRLPSDWTSSPRNFEVELHMNPLRVVVVLTLALCTERNSLDPGSLVGAAKVFPMIMAVSNFPLDNVEGSISVDRPATTKMTNMDGDETIPEIGPILFTDLNSIHTASPFWDRFFDYYDCDPDPNDEFIAVRHGASRRKIDEGAFKLGHEGRYHQSPLHKMAGQGEFDSVHIAPRMKAPDSVLYRIESDALRRSLRRIAMAPFCVHDCLHIHWRWSESFTAKHVLGWDGFTPYQKAGAPLVPPNQEVRMRLHGKGHAGLTYTARALNPAPGRWQIMFHHGMGYAISTNGTVGALVKATLAKLGMTVFAWEGPGSPWSWYAYYWRLRYSIDHVSGSEKFWENVLPAGEAGLKAPDLAHAALKRLREF